MTDYKYRGIFLIPVGISTSLNQAIKSSIDIEGGEYTFDVGASPNGSGSPTHYYCNSSLTDDAVSQIAQLAVVFPDSKSWVWVDHEQGEEGFIETVLDDLDNVFVEKKTLEEILTENNLKKMETE